MKPLELNQVTRLLLAWIMSTLAGGCHSTPRDGSAALRQLVETRAYLERFRGFGRGGVEDLEQKVLAETLDNPAPVIAMLKDSEFQRRYFAIAILHATGQLEHVGDLALVLYCLEMYERNRPGSGGDPAWGKYVLCCKSRLLRALTILDAIQRQPGLFLGKLPAFHDKDQIVSTVGLLMSDLQH